MPLKPPLPPRPQPTTPARGLASHVRAATALVQALPVPAPRTATRRPAPHVQAALGRSLQQKPDPCPRDPAPHVRTAIAQAIPRATPAAPRMEARGAGGILQRAEKSMTNIGRYSSILEHHSPDEVKEVLEETGLTVHGHHSGKRGDGMNSATEKDLEKLGEELRKKKEREKKAKKPAPRQQAAKSGYQKGMTMADRIFEEQGPDGLGAYMEYLDKQLTNSKITDEESDKLADYYMALK